MAEKLIASEIGYLDAADCGSTVGYKLITSTPYAGKGNVTPSFYAEVDLTDCGRKINWTFRNSTDALAKINKAITLLTNFKKEFVKAQKKYPKGKNATD